MQNEMIEVQNQQMPAQPDQFLGMIERLAKDPGFEITKMQALLDMRNQEFARIETLRKEELAYQAEREFDIDYIPMFAKLPFVAKTKSNTHTVSKYAALEDVNEAVKPVLSEYGFATRANIVKQTKDDITVVAILSHRGGHKQTLEITLPIDNKGSAGKANKTDIQGIASSITYAKRIAICALLNISTGDDKDGNASDDVLATIPQREAIGKLFQKLTEAHQDIFVERFGGVAEIKRKDVNEVIARLNVTIGKYNQEEK